MAQLATFSELEQMQNVAKTTEVSRATSLVGSLVSIESLNETTGVTSEVTGKVDFVSVSGNKVKVSVNDQLYDLSDVKKVYDANYADAVALAEEFASSYGKLPGVNNLTAINASSYEDRMRALYGTFSEMSIYQKTFLSADIQAGMEAYINRFKDFGIDVTKDKEESSSNSSNSSANNSTTENTAANSNTDNTAANSTTENTAANGTTENTAANSTTESTAADAAIENAAAILTEDSSDATTAAENAAANGVAGDNSSED